MRCRCRSICSRPSLCNRQMYQNLPNMYLICSLFLQALRGNKRLQICILRHLTPQQGLDLLGAATDSEHTGFGLVHGEISTLREAMEANLASLVRRSPCLPILH